MTKRYKHKCVYYCCKNNDDDIKIMWVCIDQSEQLPNFPFESICKYMWTRDVDICDDCKNYVGMLSVEDNSEGK